MEEWAKEGGKEGGREGWWVSAMLQ